MRGLPRLPGLTLASCAASEAREALAAGEPAGLTGAERRALASWPTEKRRRDWLAGRLAAKRALARHLREDRGLDLGPEEIEVLNDPAGRPSCRLARGLPAGPSLSFSLSHSEPGGLCAVSRTGSVVGVDWEAVEARPEAVFSLYAAQGERLDWGLGPAERSRLWSLKEAVLKALGLGLAADPREVAVPKPPRDGAWRPSLSGRAQARWEELGRPDLTLAAWDLPGAVAAVAHGG